MSVALGFDVYGTLVDPLGMERGRRNPEIVFDPWEFEPDIMIGNLTELVTKLK